MKAMARACHPSKNVGAILTHCPYLAIASGSSPIARSPLASSKSSSTSGGIFSKRFLFDQPLLPWSTLLKPCLSTLLYPGSRKVVALLFVVRPSAIHERRQTHTRYSAERIPHFCIPGILPRRSALSLLSG